MQNAESKAKKDKAEEYTKGAKTCEVDASERTCTRNQATEGQKRIKEQKGAKAYDETNREVEHKSKNKCKGKTKKQKRKYKYKRRQDKDLREKDEKKR